MAQQIELTERSRKAVLALLGVTGGVIALAALKIAKPVAVPFTFALFLTLLLQPVHVWLEERLPGGWSRLSAPLTLLLLVVILGAVAAGFWVAGDVVSEQAPEYVNKLQQYWERNSSWLERFGISADTPGQLAGRLSDVAASWLSSAFAMLAGVVLVFFLVLLMLLEARLWREKTEALFASDESAIDTVRTIAAKMREYLFVRTVVSAVSGIVAGLWLWIIGVDFAFLWALVTFALNYVPNIGSIISTVLPSLMALVQGGLPLGLLTLGGLTVMEQFIGNFVDPRLQGRKLVISPLVVLLSVVFWGWMWGAAGALLGVPITASVIIVCAHIRSLRPAAVLLSGAADEDEVMDHSGVSRTRR